MIALETTVATLGGEAFISLPQAPEVAHRKILRASELAPLRQGQHQLLNPCRLGSDLARIAKFDRSPGDRGNRSTAR